MKPTEPSRLRFWFARELQKLLGYDEWRNFLKFIERARESCKTANNTVLDHFVDANKSIPVPKGGNRTIEDHIQLAFPKIISSFPR